MFCLRSHVAHVHLSRIDMDMDQQRSHSIDSLCICVDLAFIMLLKFCDIGGIHGIFIGSVKSVKPMQQLVAADTFIILVALKKVFANVCLVKLSIYYVHPVSLIDHRRMQNSLRKRSTIQKTFGQTASLQHSFDEACSMNNEIHNSQNYNSLNKVKKEHRCKTLAILVLTA